LRVNIDDVIYSLKSMMWRQMGVQREAESLREAEEKLEFWARIVQQLAPSETRSWELMNMLTLSRLATLGALAREESRGVHFRTDFDQPRDEFLHHTDLVPVSDGDLLSEVQLGTTPVNDPVASA
jgi:L-aspartate oxidase